jgi:hypothetical protein
LVLADEVDDPVREGAGSAEKLGSITLRAE